MTDEQGAEPDVFHLEVVIGTPHQDWDEVVWPGSQAGPSENRLSDYLLRLREEWDEVLRRLEVGAWIVGPIRVLPRPGDTPRAEARQQARVLNEQNSAVEHAEREAKLLGDLLASIVVAAGVGDPSTQPWTGEQVGFLGTDVLEGFRQGMFRSAAQAEATTKIEAGLNEVAGALTQDDER